MNRKITVCTRCHKNLLEQRTVADQELAALQAKAKVVSARHTERLALLVTEQGALKKVNAQIDSTRKKVGRGKRKSGKPEPGD